MRAGQFRRGPFTYKSPVESIFFTTVRVEAGDSIGTAFIVSHEWKKVSDDKSSEGLFLVTNKHVVGESKTGRITLTVVGEDGARTPQDFEIPQRIWSLWCFHPETDVDICVLPFGICLNSLALQDGAKLDYACFPTALAPNEDTTPDIGLIEDVLFIGYPNGMFDEANNLPVARRGVTATPATVDYNGRPIFLIDASVFPGSSGSPVFLYNVGGWRSTRGLVAGDRVLFLGVLASVFYREEDGTIELREVPTQLQPHVSVQQMIDLGIVYKARTVRETIECVLRQFGELPP